MWSSLFVASAALADCGTWDASFFAQPEGGTSSSALSYRWSAAPACSNFSLSHYLVCRREGVAGSVPAAPTRPDEADVHCAVSVSATSRLRATDRVYKSHRAWAARVFACGDAACSSWYGPANGTRTRRTARATETAMERWVIPGVSSFSDMDRMIPDHEATAATGFIYPEMFPEAGQLVVWWSTGAGGRQNIRYQVARTAGWGTWNDNGASFYSPIRVAESADGDGRFAWVTHPWVVPAVDGGVPYVRMFFQTDDDGNPNSGRTFEVWSVDSADASGIDFSLTCTDASCAVEADSCDFGFPCDWGDASQDGGAVSLEIASDGHAFASWLTSASHGSLLFDPVDDDGAVDFGAEDPSLLFTGTAAPCSAQPDDLFLAPWGGVDWQIPMASEQCPAPALADAHDPSVVTLLDGTAKVYAQVGPDSYVVCPYDGAVGACVPIELAFDDGTPLGSVNPALGRCSDNLQIFADPASSTPHFGALLHVMGNGAGCFPERAGGIVSLELRN